MNFNVMLNLPVLLNFFFIYWYIKIIVKEKGIFERKNTLKVFNRKKIEDEFSNNKNNNTKDDILKPGKIYINELWSYKY